MKVSNNVLTPRAIFISFVFTVRYLRTPPAFETDRNHNGGISFGQNRTAEASLREHHVPLPFPSENNNGTDSPYYFDAIDTNGNRGYVADPTLFRRLVFHWHDRRPNATYWDRILQYQSHLQLDADATGSVTSEGYVCSLTSEGQGGKKAPQLSDEGVEMITRHVSVDYGTPVLRGGCTESPPLDRERPRLFCGIYTHDGARDLARLAALTYGWKCDGFLAFSTSTVPSLGMVGLLHPGWESYHNMVQKTRSILSYIAAHYIDRFDYYHIGGDDMHVIVENMRSLLLEHEAEGGDGGRIFGQLDSKGGRYLFLRGGAGYTVDRVGLKKLHEHMPKCAANSTGHWEDNMITNCARRVGLQFSGNRDTCTGQQRSHAENPSAVFRNRGEGRSEVDAKRRNWALLGHPMYPAMRMGMQLGFDAASNHSVVFHGLRYPAWMVRHHALLYGECPSNTSLGKMVVEQKDGVR